MLARSLGCCRVVDLPERVTRLVEAAFQNVLANQFPGRASVIPVGHGVQRVVGDAPLPGDLAALSRDVAAFSDWASRKIASVFCGDHSGIW